MTKEELGREATVDEGAAALLNSLWRLRPRERLRVLSSAPEREASVVVRQFELTEGVRSSAQASRVDALRRIMPVILTALAVFDVHFRRRWRCGWHPYVLSDLGVARLLDHVRVTEASEQVSSGVAVLARLGLLYRFEAAEKYSCRPGIVQIRASSWGRGSSRGSRVTSIDEDAATILVDDERYREIVELLGSAASARSAAWAQRIRLLNDTLAVPVVS